MGGRDVNGMILQSIELFDTTTNLFSQTTFNLDVPRAGFAAWYDSPTEHLYVYGGITNSTQAFELCDPAVWVCNVTFV